MRTLRNVLHPSFLVALLASPLCSSLSAQTIITDPSNAFVDGTNVEQVGGNWQIRVGNTDGVTSAAIMAFQLPTLGVGESFGTADFKIAHFYATQSDPFQTVDTAFNGDLFGLTRVSATPTVLGSDFSAAGTLLQSGFIPFSTSGYGDIATNASGDLALASFLNDQYAGGANAGQYVFLRISPDALLSGVNDFNNRFEILARGAGLSEEWPTITYTAVPEPGTTLLVMCGLSMTMLLVRRRIRLSHEVAQRD